MPVVRVFDPPMCCSTGVCGPAIDPELARFSADLDWLTKQGVQVERFNLSQTPAAFVSNAVVKDALTARGNDCLPLVVVDDRIAVEGSYPSRDTLAALAGVVVRNVVAAPAASKGCCGPSTKATPKERLRLLLKDTPCLCSTALRGTSSSPARVESVRPPSRVPRRSV